MTESAEARLMEAQVNADPIEQFRQWYEVACGLGMTEPAAVTLATATPDGRPSARVVLLKHFDQKGFVFFTNYESRKGEELGSNPRAALLFYWDGLRRQVRMEGRVEVIIAAESDRYFATRSYDSRLGAWASPQSRVIGSRDELAERIRALEKKYADGQVPRPPHWGGYRVVPDSIEFWQGRSGRLHDRLRYTRTNSQAWRIERLAP